MSEENKEQSLIAGVIDRCNKDKAFSAALKKADNPDTEYLCWEYLADYKIPLDNELKKCPYTLIFSSIAKSSCTRDGKKRIGEALADAYKDAGGRDSDAAKLKLRRLLACDNVVEVCSVLRPMLQLIVSRGVEISYAELLRDLKYFNPERTLASWAQNFFNPYMQKEEDAD